MSEHPGWHVLWGEAKNQIEVHYRHLRQGQEQVPYLKAVGWLDGVEYVQSIPRVVKAQLEREARNTGAA